MTQNSVILGGGPVGCYLAYKLLSHNNSTVTMIEARSFTRPQVIRIPFCIANDFPEDVKNKLWIDEEIRSQIFNTKLPDTDDLPMLGYSYWPFISIKSFQEIMIKFLNTKYQDKFTFISHESDLIQLDLKTEIKANTSAIFCTCGTYAKSLRTQLNLLEGKYPEDKGHGIYLIYRNTGPENYQRNSKTISSKELGERGMTYAAANNPSYDVQLYTYPIGEFEKIFADIPVEFIQHAQYRNASSPLNLTGEALPYNIKLWFERYKECALGQTQLAGIKLPSDLTSIQIFYAQRIEYYWNKVTTIENNIPLYFVGDSAGSTDYRSGLSLGRGFLSAQELSKNIINYGLIESLQTYQNYWDTLLIREFNKGPNLTTEPHIQYQYLIKGRAEIINI